MNKIRGKVLSLVLAAALVVSSFPATFASASSHHTITGSLGDFPDPENDNELALVNGGSDDQQEFDHFQAWIGGTPELDTDKHKEASDVKIADISHKSGDRLVKWEDGSDGGSIDDDTTDITLKLRSNSVNGHEVLNVLYKGTWTDDDENDYTVKASKTVDIYVFDKNQYVIGIAGKGDEGKNPELDDNFAQKTLAHEIASNKRDISNNDSKELTVFEAQPDTNSAKATWTPRKAVAKDEVTKDDQKIDLTKSDHNNDADEPYRDAYYVIDSSSDNIKLHSENATSSTTYTYGDAAVEKNTSTGSSVTTYTMSDVEAGSNTLGIALTTDGKLTVTAPSTSDTSDTSIEAYAYAVVDSETEPTDWTSVNDKIAVADIATGTDISSKLGTVAGTKYLYVAGVDDTGAKVTDGEAAEGTVTISTETTGAILEKDCPGIEQGTTDATANTLTVTKGTGDTSGSAYTYTYSVDSTEVPLTFTDDGKAAITVPTTSATPEGADCVIVVTAMSSGTVVGKTTATVNVKSVTEDADIDGDPVVTATVKDKSGTGSVTFTAKPTYWALNNRSEEEGKPSDDDEIKTKVKIEKKIIVDNTNAADFNKIGKYSGTTYIYRDSLSGTNVKADQYKAVKVNGYEVNFKDCNDQNISVDDKASVTKITGKVKSLKVASGNVSTIDVDEAPDGIVVDDAKAGSISVGGDATKCDITISSKATVGDISVDDDATDAKVTVESGKVGNIDAKNVEVKADDDDFVTTVGDITATTLSFDSEDSKISVGTVKAKDTGSEFTLTGDVTVAGFDFDYYDANLKFDDFQGKVPAPKNAAEDGAYISTTNEDDRVEVVGDVDIDGISVEDDSTMTFDGKVDVTSVDGSGTMVIKAGNLYVDGDVSGTVLKLSDPTLTKGQMVFTALSDTVNADDFDCYGFTLAKSTGSKIDTFKIDSVQFKGVTINKVSSEIAKGQSEIFTASAYPGGTSMPAGYKVEWSLDDYNDDVFALTVNADGSATVKAIGYDTDFASENKATLKAQLLDASGDEVDEDDYASGECALTAVAVPPQKFISDTKGNKAMKLGETYQFAITSTDGTKPSFAVASAGATVTNAGASGNKYFFKVKAAKVGSYGVYAGGTRVAILVISSDVTLDTSKVTVKAGSSYQFEATAPKQPVFQVAGIGTIALRSHSGSNYYFKVTVPSKTAKGGHGVYVNGVRMAVVTVA